MTIKDGRYYIGLEFCGAPTQKWVLRWCGDFVKDCDSKKEAEVLAVQHAEARGHNHTGWILLACIGSVIWLRRGKLFRVAYGADIKESKDDIQAAHYFGEAICHQLHCEGVL